MPKSTQWTASGATSAGVVITPPTNARVVIKGVTWGMQAAAVATGISNATLLQILDGAAVIYSIPMIMIGNEELSKKWEEFFGEDGLGIQGANATINFSTGTGGYTFGVFAWGYYSR